MPTKGKLRRDASRVAKKEKNRAAVAVKPYNGYPISYKSTEFIMEVDGEWMIGDYL